VKKKVEENRILLTKYKIQDVISAQDLDLQLKILQNGIDFKFKQHTAEISIIANKVLDSKLDRNQLEGFLNQKVNNKEFDLLDNRIMKIKLTVDTVSDMLYGFKKEKNRPILVQVFYFLDYFNFCFFRMMMLMGS
jgi:hypothetical protein